MERLSRYIFLLRTFVRGGGYTRAEFLKKKGYFKSIGEHCYLQPWKFGTEPHMISFGNSVHVASGVTFINHDITTESLVAVGCDSRIKFDVLPRSPRVCSPRMVYKFIFCLSFLLCQQRPLR